MPRGDPPAEGLAVDGRPKCPSCGSTHRVQDVASTETHCGECGLVFGADLVTDDIPIRSEGAKSEGGRGVGPFSPTGSARRQLGSVLGGAKDGNGHRLDSAQRTHYQRLRWLMDREVARRSDNLLDRSPARETLARAASSLTLPPVVLAESERLFREGSARGIFRGRSLAASSGAALYGACRRYGVPRSLGEISKAVGLRRSEVGRAFKALSRGLDIPLPSVNLQSYLQRYAQELALSPQVRSNVEALLQSASDHPEVSGLSPQGLVAAMIYIASEKHGEPRSRTRVAKVGSVTEVTLRSTSRVLTRLLPELEERKADASPGKA